MRYNFEALLPLLKKQRWSQRQFAQHIGMDRAQFNRLIHNTHPNSPTLLTFHKIANGLEMPIQELIELIEVEENEQ